MSVFTENVNIVPLPKQNLWMTTKELLYYVGNEFSDEKIIVPSGFVFDWASVPMIFGNIIQRVEPRTLSSACIHDYMYTNKIYKRSKCDKIFYEALIVSGTRKWKAKCMYWGVRLGWRMYWK